jgi:hypothetical protein
MSKQTPMSKLYSHCDRHIEMVHIRKFKIIILFILLGTAGCSMPDSDLSGLSAYPKYFKGIDGKPRYRLGCYPTATLTSFFPDPDNLGPHGYSGSLSEKNGILYTCRAGHLDLTHIRIASDWTAYLAAKTFIALMKNRSSFSFKMNTEPSIYSVNITYPENWKNIVRKEEQAYEISIKVGQYLAFTATSWHEILTWYGYKIIGIYPEYPSAFSWEDSYSNLLGTRIGVEALNDKEHFYNKAVEIAINKELKNLGLLPGNAARRIANSVKGFWYTGDLCFVEMRMRSCDIGTENGYVTPILVPNVKECVGVQPQPYPVPTLDFLSEYGIQMKVEIEPHEWEKNKILRIIYPDKKTRKKVIEPAVHLPIIISQIKKEAEVKYGRKLNRTQKVVVPR